MTDPQDLDLNAALAMTKLEYVALQLYIHKDMTTVGATIVASKLLKECANMEAKQSDTEPPTIY